MFTGIIEATGLITNVTKSGSNQVFQVESLLGPYLKIDQSLSHNGVCLTVESIDENMHTVTAIAETLSKTTLGSWKKGNPVNLERSVQLNTRLDGHMVQGHVDTKGVCTNIKALEGSWLYRFRYPLDFAPLVIEKGSICVNGISLTLFDISENEFTVAIVPYTFEHTAINKTEEGDEVNIEFDLIGKYINRHLQLKRD